MRQPIEVKYLSGETVDLIAVYPDFVLFEEKFQKHPIVLTMDDFRMTDQGFLAWACLTREKKTELSWEDWRNTVESVRYTDEDVDLVPLENHQHIGSSQN